MKTQFIAEFLDKRKEKGQLRKMRCISNNGVEINTDNKRLVNFSSNNTLGLSSHPLLIKRSADFAKKFGTGAGASRLVCGNLSFHEEIEKKLAASVGTETSLLFNSGYQANATVLAALADRHSLVIADKNCHHSLLHGALTSHAKVIRYRHNDLNHLETLLSTASRKSFSRIVVVTESIFSIDGDQTDIHALKNIADSYKALLYIDEAHAFGIAGKNGMGLCAGISGIDIVMGGFGKAAGSSGGYIACTNEMREYLINSCPGIVYSTAIAPPVAGAIDAALEIIPKLDKERMRLNSLAHWLRTALNVTSSTTHIIPVWLKSSRDALKVSDTLEKKGILLYPIRPPTVPQGTLCLRISLSSQHTQKHLHMLVNALSETLHGE